MSTGAVAAASGPTGTVGASSAATMSSTVGMNRSGQIQVFQSTPEPDDAALKAGQAKALAEQRAAAASLGKRSDDVVAKPLAPQLAFERFAGKVFDTTRADFSDRVVKSQLRALSSSRTEFAALHPVGSASAALFESPLERYMRLQHEVKTFSAELEALVRTEQAAKQSSEQVKAITDVSALLAADLRSIEAELHAAAGNKAFAAYLSPAAAGAAGAAGATTTSATGTAVALAAALQTVRGERKDDKKGGAGGSDKPVLELYATGAAGSAAPEQLQSLDKRLAMLEKLVGTTESASASFPDVQTGLKTLSKKLELLDAQRLDSLYRRVKGVLTELESLEAAKKAVAAGGGSGAATPTGSAGGSGGGRDPATEEKVEQLYGLMTRWDSAAQSLPVVVARLQSLKDVHDECAGVVVRLQGVEQSAAQAAATVEADRAALATLSKNLTTNLSVIQSNVASLETRFAALGAKMDQLAKLKLV